MPQVRQTLSERSLGWFTQRRHDEAARKEGAAGAPRPPAAAVAWKEMGDGLGAGGAAAAGAAAGAAAVEKASGASCSMKTLPQPHLIFSRGLPARSSGTSMWRRHATHWIVMALP